MNSSRLRTCSTRITTTVTTTIIIYYYFITQSGFLTPAAAHVHHLQGQSLCWGEKLADRLVQLQQSASQARSREPSVEAADSIQEHEPDSELEPELDEAEQEKQRAAVEFLFRHHQLACESHYPIMCSLHSLWPSSIACRVSNGVCRSDVSWIYESGVKCNPQHYRHHDRPTTANSSSCYFPARHQLRPHRPPKHCTAYFDFTHTADAVATSLLLILALTLALTIAHCTFCVMTGLQSGRNWEKSGRYRLHQSGDSDDVLLLPEPACCSSPSCDCSSALTNKCSKMITSLLVAMGYIQRQQRPVFSTTGKND